jgi:SAM-dependent methyltransferase
MLWNQRAMEAPAAVAQYVAASGLEPSEAAALTYAVAALGGDLQNAPVLDLGVGGGRTIAPLRAVSRDYTGLDYSPAMVTAARTRHPGVRIDHGDATKLHDLYARDYFQLVVFSCNGLGMASHADRLRILAAVHRVLRPGGLFVFSNHNRSSPEHARAFALPEIELDLRHRPVRSAVHAARFARDVAVRAVNRMRYLPHQINTPDYSIVNSPSHNYGVMLYLIDLARQTRQLADAGFDLLAAFDLSGREITEDTRDDSILYVARKPVA